MKVHDFKFGHKTKPNKTFVSLIDNSIIESSKIIRARSLNKHHDACRFYENYDIKPPNFDANGNGTDTNNLCEGTFIDEKSAE